MIKEFNNLKEIKKYYVDAINTYVFSENGDYIDLVAFNFNLCLNANIKAKNINAWNIDALNIKAKNIKADNINASDIIACDIKAWDINAHNITAWDIAAWNINANAIDYYGICFAYNNIKCKSINGRRKNAKHFVLDGKLEVEENE